MPATSPSVTDVVKRERSRLGNFIRSRVRNSGDAEDIMQDVLMEFALATEVVEQAGAWLMRVAKNRIIDRARKKKEEPLPLNSNDDAGFDDINWLEDNLPDPSAGPEAAYARTVLLQAIQAALDELPPEQRDVFMAHELEGQSFAEMAAETGVPQNTLLARKRYAVLHLRARLQEQYGDLII